MANEIQEKKGKNWRTNCIMVRLNDEEYETVKIQAEKVCLAPAIYARNCVLGNKITPRNQSKIYGKYVNQLSWIGNNLNQIAKAVNYKAKNQDETFNLIELNIRLQEIQTELKSLLYLIHLDSEK